MTRHVEFPMKYGGNGRTACETPAQTGTFRTSHKNRPTLLKYTQGVTTARTYKKRTGALGIEVQYKEHRRRPNLIHLGL